MKQLTLGLLMIGMCAVPSRWAAAQVYSAPDELAIVVNVSTPALFDGRGETAPDAAARLEAIAEVLERMQGLEDVPFSLAVTGVLCDELRLVSLTAAERVHAALRALATGRQVLAAPYAQARLSYMSPEEVQDEISRGNRAIEECLGAAPSPALFPPDLQIDEDALSEASANGISVALTNLVTEPILVEGVAIVSAAESRGADANDVLQGFDPLRNAAVVVPADDARSVSFMESLLLMPDVQLRYLEELVQGARPRRMPSIREEPSNEWRRSLRAAQRELETFRSFTTEDNRLRAIFATVVARGASSSDWDADWSVGAGLLDELSRNIRAQQQLVSVSDGSITFTSQQGSLPITVSNSADYPVRVRIRVSSPKLDFPDGSTQVVTVEPPGGTFTFEALARSTGTFPTRVIVTSPDGEVTFDRSQITVRSTGANIAALVLTGGGALFLVVWAGRRASRHRKGRVAVR